MRTISIPADRGFAQCIAERVHALAEQPGIKLFGRAMNRHFLCYTGRQRFDAALEPRRGA